MVQDTPLIETASYDAPSATEPAETKLLVILGIPGVAQIASHFQSYVGNALFIGFAGSSYKSAPPSYSAHTSGCGTELAPWEIVRALQDVYRTSHAISREA